MRIAIASVVGISAAMFSVGCEVHERGPDAQVAVGVGVDADVETAGPLFDDPAIVGIDIEPAPTERQYVYDPGFPPGVYLYDNYYYYGGYRYPHDVFINRYVQPNIQRGRYTNVEQNRQQGQQIEQRQRTEFAKTGGHRTAANRAPANRVEQNRNDVNKADANRTDRPADRSVTEQPNRSNATPEQRAAEDRKVTPEQRPAEDRKVAPEQRQAEDRKVTPEQRPDAKTTEARPAQPREEHPEAKPEQRNVEPKPGAERPAADRPEDRHDDSQK